MAPVRVRVAVANDGRNYRGRQAIDQLWGSSERLLSKVRIRIATFDDAVKGQHRLDRLGPYPDASHDLEIDIAIGALPIRSARLRQKARQAAALILLPLLVDTSWHAIAIRINRMRVSRRNLAAMLETL